MEIDITVMYDIRSPHRYCRECNALLKDYGGKKHLAHPFGTLISDVWTDIYRIRHKKRRDEHPCQLPVHLLERLILMVTDEGDIVLDPFVGTGTTAIAAKKLGRSYVGIDIDPGYVKMTEEKLEGLVPTQINGWYVSVFLGKIVTVRDLDYEKVKSLLKTRELRINAKKSKQLTLPVLSEKEFRSSPDSSRKLGEHPYIEAKTPAPERRAKQVQQAHLLESRETYKSTEAKDA